MQQKIHWMQILKPTCRPVAMWAPAWSSLSDRDKYIFEYETNTFGNLRQMHLAIWDKCILQFETNTFGNLRQIHFAIWDKYILKFETDIFCNLTQIPLAIWDK